MGLPIYQALDVAGLESLASNPVTNLFQGRVYFNTTINKPMTYDGTAWNEGAYESGIPAVTLYNKTIGPSGNYTTIANALASAVMGDSFLVIGNTTETQEIAISLDNIVIDQLPSSTITMDVSGRLVNFTGKNIRSNLFLRWLNTASPVTDLLILGISGRNNFNIEAFNAASTAITNLVGGAGHGTIAKISYSKNNTSVTNPLITTNINNVDSLIF